MPAGMVLLSGQLCLCYKDPGTPSKRGVEKLGFSEAEHLQSFGLKENVSAPHATSKNIVLAIAEFLLLRNYFLTLHKHCMFQKKILVYSSQLYFINPLKLQEKTKGGGKKTPKANLHLETRLWVQGRGHWTAGKGWLFHKPSWESDSLSLSISFLICKIIVIATLQGLVRTD